MYYLTVLALPGIVFYRDNNTASSLVGASAEGRDTYSDCLSNDGAGDESYNLVFRFSF